MSDSILWRYPNPFIQQWVIQPNDIDHYNHVNNVAYLSQQEQLAWAHSRSLGLSFEQYQALDRGMVIFRHELDYVKPALLGDTLLCATWITECEGRITLDREFQYVRESDGETLYRGKTQFACVKLSTGQPTRMPKAFRDIYVPAAVNAAQNKAD